MATFWIGEKLRLSVKIRYKSVMRDEYKRREVYFVLFYFILLVTLLAHGGKNKLNYFHFC